MGNPSLTRKRGRGQGKAGTRQPTETSLDMAARERVRELAELAGQAAREIDDLACELDGAADLQGGDPCAFDPSIARSSLQALAERVLRIQVGVSTLVAVADDEERAHG